MECGNWRGITLLPVAAKVLGKVIITTTRDTVETRHKKRQGLGVGKADIQFEKHN